MTTYRAPQRDMRFVLHELLEVEKLAALPGYEDATAELIDQVIEEGAKLCENVLFPINRAGDEAGCVYENGVVRTPAGFKDAYDAFVAGGWTGLAADPDYGGQGLPKTIKFVIDEMVCSANLAFSTYPGLSGGAYHAISLHADDGAQGALPAEARGGPLERHDVPDRAPVRHRPRPDPDPRRAHGRRQLRASPGPRSSSPPASTI